MLSDNWDGSTTSLLLALPDGILAVVTRSLTPKDVCNLCACCRSLYTLATSDQFWLNQCGFLGIVPHLVLFEWRKGVLSYRALCRFLYSVRPMIDHNPELGNVVYVMPGFISVVGCRIIPQELGLCGLPRLKLWVVLMVLRRLIFMGERETDYLYPASIKAIDRDCNVGRTEAPKKLVHSKSFAINHLDKELSRKICPTDGVGISKSQRILGQNASSVSFSPPTFVDRRKLIEIVTSQVRVKVPDSANK